METSKTKSCFRMESALHGSYCHPLLPRVQTQGWGSRQPLETCLAVEGRVSSPECTKIHTLIDPRGGELLFPLHARILALWSRLAPKPNNAGHTAYDTKTQDSNGDGRSCLAVLRPLSFRPRGSAACLTSPLRGQEDLGC